MFELRPSRIVSVRDVSNVEVECLGLKPCYDGESEIYMVKCCNKPGFLVFLRWCRVVKLVSKRLILWGFCWVSELE